MQATLKNKIATVLLLSLISLILFALGFYSFAWLSKTFKSGEIGFTAGELDGCELEIAKIVPPADNTVAVDESMREYTPCENMYIDSESLPLQNGDGYTISLEQMTLGFIDNVVLLRPDNIVYFRLSVPKENGKNLNLKLFYDTHEDGNFVEIYKNKYDVDGETVKAQEKVQKTDTIENSETPILDAFQSVESEDIAGDCFLKYSVLLSNEKYEASELSTLSFFGKGVAEVTEDADTSFRFNDPEGDYISLVNEEIESAGEFYYVYIKVEPNLSVFSYSIEYISGIMPCYVYFRVKASFEIY
jgi:hypothetical protein